MKVKVLTEIWYPSTQELYDSLIAATQLPDKERKALVEEAFLSGKMKHAVNGDVVEDIPSGSCTWMLQQNIVESIEDTPVAEEDS